MTLKSICINPIDDLSTEDQLNKIYQENKINKNNIVSIITFGSSVIITWDDELEELKENLK